ncbi:DEAD/DEAH box helicase [Paenibacillus sp. 1P07SE]|uniref:DEAD/DEAH box helicase n=1 Tax=Paenibacillus sp. 1P07SE TaxID=3132209 RepID=UPI0039A6E73B
MASSSHEAHLLFHPVLADWFAAAFGQPTAVQVDAWRAIRSGADTLIAAPTGSGKTLAALLPCLDRIVRAKLAGGGAPRGVRVVYITPLKALNNDIHHHIESFVTEIDAAAVASGGSWPGLRSAVRTGDTKSSQRAAMLRQPPDVLVTTPESLYILLTSEKGRQMLAPVEQVIVDEIHDLASDKRGSHLSLTLERLVHACGRPIQRIGVSATQRPLWRVAQFLGGWEPDGEAAGGAALMDSSSDESETFRHPLGYRPRPVTIIESPMEKRLDVQVTMPDQGLPMTTRESVWFPLMDRILQLMEGCRSVLIFTVSRRLCERLTLRLNDYVGYEMAKSHHGSLARERRLEVEQQLKNGELRALIATSSLELGIDVGHIDLVIQIDSPLSAAAGIQRIGRAGHQVGAPSRGYLLARHPGGLPEVAVLSRMIRERDIEAITIPRDPIDVLSQQCVAMAAMDDWTLTALHRLIVRSDSFRSLPQPRLEAMLQVLSGFYPFARPLLQWDKGQDRLTKLRSTAMAALTGAGTIPQSSGYPVHHADSRAHLGELDEEFVHESRVGDVFQLGTSSWMIREIRQDRVYVAETANAFSEIPFWRNEAGGRSYELGEALGRFLAELLERLERDPADAGMPEQVMNWLSDDYGMDGRSGDRLIELIRSQAAVTPLPTDTCLVIERYQDLQGKTHVILHNHWGRRVNRTWQLALERQMQQVLPYRIYGNAKDSGIEFVLPEWDSSWLELFWQVTPDSLEELLLTAIPGSPLLAIAFRRIAETSLLLSRSFKRTPMWQKRLRSEELLKESLPYAEQFPYLQEAMQECLHVYLDLDTLKQQLERIQSGEIAVEICETRRPSPLAARFVEDYASMQLYEGEGLDPAVQLQLMQVSKEWAGRLFGQETLQQALDPEVIERERQRLAEPAQTPRDAGELLGLLKRRGDASLSELQRLAGAETAGWLQELERSRLALRRAFGAEERWVCADEQELYEQFPATPASVALIAGRFAEYRMAFTREELQDRYPALSDSEAEQVVEELVLQDKIEQAPFAADPDEPLWSSRKVASRIVRLSIQSARRQGEPASPERWCGQIARMQHVTQSARLSGSEGLRTVIGQLQGFFLPLSHWESIILPSRLHDYRRETLDLLCASGEIIWIGRREGDEKEGKVAFFLAEAKALYGPYLKQLPAPESSKHPELLASVRRLGASFITRLSREFGLPPSELLEQLLELVWEGHVANDQFAPLRLHGGRRSKGLGKQGTGQGRWYWTGSLLEDEWSEDEADEQPAERDGQPDPPGSDAPSLRSLMTGGLGGEAAGGHPADGLRGAVSNGQLADSLRGVVPNKHRADGLRGAAGERRTDSLQGAALQWVHHLLQSHGILTRELVSSVSPFDWDRLLPVMRQLEEWGAVSRGLFIRDKQAMQFTTRELMAAIRRPLQQQDDELIVLSAVDPANPFGLIADWPAERGVSYARKSGNYLVLKGERWIAWVENNGRRIRLREPGTATADEGGEGARAGEREDAEVRADTGAGEKATGKSGGVNGDGRGDPSADASGARQSASQRRNGASSKAAAIRARGLEDSQAAQSPGSQSSPVNAPASHPARPRAKQQPAAELPELSREDLVQLFRAILQQQPLSKVKVELWNGGPIAGSAGAELLLALGAERDGKSLVLWPSQLR